MRPCIDRVDGAVKEIARSRGRRGGPRRQPAAPRVPGLLEAQAQQPATTRPSGGTQNRNDGENSYMSVLPARPIRARRSERTSAANATVGAVRLDPAVDFERYRDPACRRFKAMARTLGHHAFHDLDELAADFYDDFWTDWLARPRNELSGSPVNYIAVAMMNKLRDLNRRGRSVRPPELVRSDGDEILATVAAADLEPYEQLVLQEQMWVVSEIVRSLPARERVAFAAVFSRDSRKKGSPPAGYKLAASQLGVSEVRAKKLSLAANRRIRAAVEEVESGSWCRRWARSIQLVAAGGGGDPEFLRHAEHCLQCRLSVVHLRQQAALLPLPVVALDSQSGLPLRVWRHARSAWNAAYHQLANVLGRHANAAGEASGLVSAGGGAGGVGVTALKLGAVCLGVGLTGGAASVCMHAVGVPTPIAAMISGGHHERAHPGGHRALRARISIAAPPITPAPAPARAAVELPARGARRSSGPSSSQHGGSGSSSGGQSGSVAAVQEEFNPGGGAGSRLPSDGSSTFHAASGTAARAASTHESPSGHSSTASKPAADARQSGSSGGSETVTSGASNSLTAP
jgi:hypothetical protein